MKLEGNQGFLGMKQGNGFVSKKVSQEDKSMGKSAFHGLPKNNTDRYTPSQSSPLPGQPEESIVSTETSEESVLQNQETVATASNKTIVGSTKSSVETFSTTADYSKYLLEKYEGMTTYNITVSEKALAQAMADPEKAKTLENYIANTIDTHENYDGDWILVHSQTNIEEIGENGRVAMSGLYVLASDEKYAEAFRNKMDTENFTNQLERLLLENDSMFQDKEIEMIKEILSLFDSIYNDKNPATGQANFLNSIFMTADKISEDLISYNEGLLDDVEALQEKISEFMENDDISDTMRSILGETMEKLDSVLEGDNPLYEMRLGTINITVKGINPEFTISGKDDGETTLVTGELPSFDAFKAYFFESNNNIVNLMINQEESTDPNMVLEAYFESLLKAQEERATISE